MFKAKSDFTEIKRLENFFTDGRIQLTSDGNFALCCQHHVINVLNFGTGTIEFSISHEDKSKITYFHLTSDDKYLFTSNNEFLLRQWNFKDRCLVKSWRSDHRAPVACMDSCLSEEGGALLCTGSSDASARVFDYESKNVKNIFKKHSGVVSLVKFNPLQANQLFTSCASYAIKLWDLTSNKCLQVMDGHFSVVTSLVFSKKNNLFYSGSRDKVVMMWKGDAKAASRTIAVFESIEEMLLLEGGSKECRHLLDADHNDDHLLIAGDKGKLSIWNIPKSCKVPLKNGKVPLNDEENREMMDTDCLVQCMRGAAGCYVTVNAEQVIAVHHPTTLLPTKQFSGNNDQILDIKFLQCHDEETEHLLVATNSHKLRVYSTKDWSCRLYAGHTDVIVAVESMMASDADSYVATASKDNTVRLWKVLEGGRLQNLAVAEGHLHTVSCVTFIKVASKNQSSQVFLASGSNDKTMRLWKYSAAQEELKLKLVIEAHTDDINYITVSPDSNVIATASRDKTAKLWSRSEFKLLGSLKGHKRGVWMVEFSQVSKLAATSSADTTIKIWELNSFTCIKSLEQHQSSVLRGYFITGENQFISGDSSGCLKLWDIKSRTCECSVDCHDDKMWALSVNQSQNKVVTGDAEGVLVYWSMVTKEEKDLEEAAKFKELKLQEQQLDNLMQAGNYTAALSLAISLNQPRRSLLIVTYLWQQKEGKLQKTLSSLNDNLIRALLEYTVVWSKSHVNYVVCETIRHHYLTTLSQEQFIALDNGQHLLDNLFLTSKKIHGKWKQLNIESTFINFLLKTMSLSTIGISEFTNKKKELMEVEQESSDDSD